MVLSPRAQQRAPFCFVKKLGFLSENVENPTESMDTVFYAKEAPRA